MSVMHLSLVKCNKNAYVHFLMAYTLVTLREGDCNCYKTVHYDRNVPHFKLKLKNYAM